MLMSWSGLLTGILPLLSRSHYQIPQSGGKYITDGRFVAIAKELGILPINLMHIMYTRYGYIRSYWRVGTSDGVTPQKSLGSYARR